MSTLTNILGKLALTFYLFVAFLVGLDKTGHSGSAIMAIVQGSLWPITLLVALIKAS